nr:glycosyltransferase [Methanobrevibacter sp.]
MKTTLLIPCYNESKTIEKVVTDFKRTMPHTDIYLYDNNSTGGTDKIAENTSAIVRYGYEQPG